MAAISPKSELVKACYFDDPLSDAAERFSRSLEEGVEKDFSIR